MGLQSFVRQGQNIEYEFKIEEAKLYFMLSMVCNEYIRVTYHAFFKRQTELTNIIDNSM
jgi:hypothetical protein